MAASSLGDIAEIIMGQSPPGETCNTGGVGLPLLNGPTEYGPHHPSPVQFTTAARKRARPGDILFCVRGSTTGRMNWADREYVIGRGVAAIRHKTKPELQPLVRAVIEYGLPELLAQATGSTFPNVSADQLSRLWWPPLKDDEQRAIAHILGTLDDKIELNRRMNETLEAMARALFRSWFVDFDPVRAKAEGRDHGLPQPIADLFPHRFEDSELGEIPEGWLVTTLGAEADIVKGKSYSSDELQPSRSALVTLKSFARGGGYRPEGLKPFTGDFRPEQVIRPGEVVISFTDVTQAAEVIGRPAIVRMSPDYNTLVASLDVGIVRPRTAEFSAPYLYNLLASQDFTDHILGYVNGTTVLHLDKEGLRAYQFARPSAQALQAYAAAAVPMFERIDANEHQSRTLAALRDTLLPKLISGELQVQDAERFIGENMT